jgi:hypothetical protein
MFWLRSRVGPAAIVLEGSIAADRFIMNLYSQVSAWKQARVTARGGRLFERSGTR